MSYLDIKCWNVFKKCQKKNHEILMNIICVLPYPISFVHLRKQQNTAV